MLSARPDMQMINAKEGNGRYCHKGDFGQCPLFRRSWGMSGHNADASGTEAIDLAAAYPRQFSCSSLCNAAALGLIVLSQIVERPDSYLEPSFFETMPSKPSWHTCLKAIFCRRIDWLTLSRVSQPGPFLAVIRALAGRQQQQYAAVRHLRRQRVPRVWGDGLALTAGRHRPDLRRALHLRN